MQYSVYAAGKLALAASLLFVGIGCGPKTPNSTIGPGDNAVIGTPVPGESKASSGDSDAVVVNTGVRTYRLNATENSDISGKVTLTSLEKSRTSVDVELAGTSNETLVVAIYAGNCKAPYSEPKHGLNPLVLGKSTTTLDLSIAALTGSTPYAIRVTGGSAIGSVRFAACADL